MGSMEKEVAYVTLLCFSIPILSIPILHQYLRTNIYRLTAVLVAFLVGFILIVYHRFHWIIWLSDRFQHFSKARL